MNHMKFAKLVVWVSALFLCLASTAQAFSLNDVDLWAGSGESEAGMIVHWSSPEVFNLAYSGGQNTPMPAPIANVSYAWGYRFDGAPNGWDMVTAIAAADSRLYVVGGSGTVQGIGYDLDGDGEYGIGNGARTYTQDDFTDGVLGGLGYSVDDLVPTDDGDLYWGGWYGPNWELWHGQGGSGGFTSAPDRGSDEFWTQTDPFGFAGYHGEWSFSEVGIGGISLEAGSWVGWSVAAGGLDYGSPSDPGTIAWNGHKQAPAAPAVPVPAAAWLLGSALVGLVGLRRRSQG